MLSKLFDAIPHRYRYIVIATVTAISIPLIGLAVYSTFPETAPESAELPRLAAGQTVEQSEASTPEASKLIITPLPNGSTPDSSAPAISAPASSAPASSATDAGSLEAIEDLPQLEEYAAQYDSLTDTKFNHFPYDEAYGGDIESVGMFTRESYEREEYLHYEAADAFEQMKAAAAADFIKIQAISGFRTIARQAALFDNQVTKLGSEAAAAKLSAPPGHSEHHTGYAVDIGDVTLPETDITYDFENTPAYSWLLANAIGFGFEQSFPRNNLQGVSFEPWHWRYIGSQKAAEVFALSRSLP